MKNTLWTKDFTIITIGSVISMFGNALAGFAMSLLVLDYTGSTFLYALYNVLYFLPNAIVPVLCGPFLDRFSRKKTIYTLDFFTAGLCIVGAVILKLGLFNFAVLALGTMLLGTINSVYSVAYQSFYPLLITEGNYSKAYSIASILETLAMVMVPVSAFVYNSVGIAPLFLFNGVTYLIAAIMETRITAKEDYIEARRLSGESAKAGRQFISDFKEGIAYLVTEKGLLAVAIYFTFSAFYSGVSNAIVLPYFKSTFENGEYIYMLVFGMTVLGRAVGGAYHYRRKLPIGKKFLIAAIVYITVSIIDGVFLFFPIAVMMIFMFIDGLMGITSYTIRVSATQSYVPDEKKGRFNGVFGTINTVGMVIGQIVAGALAEFLPIRGVVLGAALIVTVSAVVFIVGNKKHIAPIYNTDK